MSEEKKKKVRVNSKNANNVIAHDICESSYFKDNLVYFRQYDSFFLYTDNKYFKRLDNYDFARTVLRFAETQYPYQGFTSSQIKDIIELIKLKIYRTETKEDTQYLAFNDCLYNTRTHTTSEFSPDKLTTWSLPYNIADLKNPTLVFKRFLETSLVEKDDHNTPDFELINLVQEMMGFLLLDSDYATGAFFLYGRGSNGKGKLSDLIRELIGKDYVSALSLGQLSQQFETVSLINKRANISAEEDDKFASSKVFKAVVTGDYIHGRHLYGAGFDFKPTAKFLFSTNKLPTFDGLDYGLKRRIFIIPFYRNFLPHEQDKRLAEKLSLEIPGIIGWALEGAKRLAANDFVFSYSKASAEVFAEFEEEMSGAIMFFNENYIVDGEERIPRQDLYQHYLDWSRDNGKRGSYSKRRFDKELLDNIKGLDGNVFTTRDRTSFRAFNCKPYNRDAKPAPYESYLTQDKNYLEGDEAKEAYPELAKLL